MLHVVVAVLGTLACFVATGGTKNTGNGIFMFIIYIVSHGMMVCISWLDFMLGRTGSIGRFVAFAAMSACLFVNARIFAAMRWLGADREMVWALAALAGVLMASQIGSIARYLFHCFPDLEYSIKVGEAPQEVERNYFLLWLGQLVMLALPWVRLGLRLKPPPG